jgi:hypothetical protein
MRTFYKTQLLVVLPFVVSCGTGASSSEPGSAPEKCDRWATMCSSSYAVCIDVVDGVGHCVDWRTLGATACPHGPTDCPAPSPRLTSEAASSFLPSALCIASNVLQERIYSIFERDAEAQPSAPGLCAGFQNYLDFDKVSDCTNNPCGSNGYCAIVPGDDANIVECLWPL